MKTALKFRKFNRDKSVEELFYNTSIWTAKLEFITIELEFTYKLIKSYPFTNNVPNLFERIQLFIQEIETLKKEKNDILRSIQKHENQLNGMLECNDLSCDNFYVVEHENLAATVFNYLQKQQDFKSSIYEYISSIIH